MKDGKYSDIARRRGWIRVRTDIEDLLLAMPHEDMGNTVKEALRFIQPDNKETAEEII